MPPNLSIPNPLQRVKLHRQAGLCSNPDDVPDSELFGYNPTGLSDDEGVRIFPIIPLLLPRLRKRRRGRGRWRLRWRRSKGPSRNDERSRVRPRHGAARNRNPCEGSARVLRYRFAYSGTGVSLVLLLFIPFTVAVHCCKLALLYASLPQTRYSRACSVIF